MGAKICLNGQRKGQTNPYTWLELEDNGVCKKICINSHFFSN